MSPERATYGLWVIWVLSWLAAALWSERTTSRPGMSAELAYRVITLAGTYLLFGFASAAADPKWRRWSLAHAGWLAQPVVRVPAAAGWLLFAITLLGFAFCWWARIHLGRLWSGTVTRKAGHRIVDTGPYRLVRHPIYTGLILAGAAMAGLKETFIALVGFLLLTLGCWIKARLEERFLRGELGAEAYDAYSRRTPMLVPFALRPG